MDWQSELRKPVAQIIEEFCAIFRPYVRRAVAENRPVSKQEVRELAYTLWLQNVSLGDGNRNPAEENWYCAEWHLYLEAFRSQRLDNFSIEGAGMTADEASDRIASMRRAWGIE